MRHAIRGVNLGGWLVLERWMTPSLFEGTAAEDELGYCAGADRRLRDRLHKHRETFVTADDFRWLASQGIEAVRIPVGYWTFGDDKPFAATIGYLDRAFAWAEETGIKVLISLHGAPGSQNGNDHSGCKGPVAWHTDPRHVEATLAVIRKLARRYKDAPALLGISVLNEPDVDIPRPTLAGFYVSAYRIIRQECGPRPWVVFSDGFRPDRWRWVLHKWLYRGAYIDTHQYQVFGQADKDMPGAEHLRHTLRDIPLLLNRMRRHHPVVVGEWSAALDPRSLTGLDAAAQQEMLAAYCLAQRQVYDRMDAWFYWSYKTESGGPWSYRHCAERGWFGQAAADH